MKNQLTKHANKTDYKSTTRIIFQNMMLVFMVMLIIAGIAIMSMMTIITDCNNFLE